jgi:membrane protease YdiL (CAAX protease family)
MLDGSDPAPRRAAAALRPRPQQGRPGWRVPWDFGDLLIFLALYVLGAIVLGFIASAPCDFQTSLPGSSCSSIWQSLAERLFPRTPSAELRAAGSLALQTVLYAMALAVILGLALGRRRARIAGLGWRMPRIFWIPLAVVAAALALVILTLIADAIQALFPQAQNGQVPEVQGEYGGYLAFAIPAVSVVAPIVEETFFRGFVYGWMRRHLNVPAAAVLSGCFFALVHFQPVIFLPLAVLGVGLALLYEYSGSLLPGMIVHALFNLVEVIGILVPGSFP